MSEADVPNAEIARILRDLADMLEIQGSNLFRVRAYRNAARTAETWSEPIAAIAKRGDAALTELPFIGADMAGKIQEIVRTGTLSQYKEEGGRVPPGLLDLLRVPGLGPKRVRQLREELGVQSLGDLEAALRAGKVRKLRGFTAKTEARLLDDVSSLGHSGKRFLRASVGVYAEAMLGALRKTKGVHQAEIAGAFRRRKDAIVSLDLLVDCDPGCRVIDAFTRYDGVAEVLETERDSASVRLLSGLRMNLRVVPPEAFGAALLAYTGSETHVAQLGTFANSRGVAIDRLPGSSEQEIYAAIGVPWIQPELREGRGEIEAAQAGKLPTLLELQDVRGDLQMHTVASDGRNTLETMALAAQELGYEYIAITDHTPALKMIQGLDREGFVKQGKEIDRLNGKLKTLTILRAAEVDILGDGTLDLDDDTLRELDLVVVSLHSKLSLEPDEQTKRVVRGLSHPSVDIMGHPRGRMILKREGARFDLDQVCKAAKDNGVMLEVNAQPDRLDLDDKDVHRALELGLTLVVSTDAHSTRELLNMRWGVDQARRGWATKERVANTRPLEEFRKLLHGHRR